MAPPTLAGITGGTGATGETGAAGETGDCWDHPIATRDLAKLTYLSCMPLILQQEIQIL